MFRKTKEQNQVDKVFQKIVANLGSSAVHTDEAELPHNIPDEHDKLSSWQYTQGDVDAEALSDLAWESKGEGETDVHTPFNSQIPVQGIGRPKYVHTHADNRASSAAEFAAHVHDDLSHL